MSGIAIVHTSSASMPASVKSPYGNVYVIEVPYWMAWHKGQIATLRSKHVKRIIWRRERLNVGKTERSAFGKALVEAHILAEQWNNARDIAEAELLISTGSA